MKTGIIGSIGHLGYVSESVAPGEVTAVAPGIEGEDMSQALALFPSARVYSHAYELLADSGAEMVTVNSYANVNYLYTADALSRGIHVFAEKPLAVSLPQLEQIRSALAVSSAKLSCMLALRGEPHFLAAKQAVADGKIGRVRLVTAQKSYKLGIRPDYYRNADLYGGLIGWVSIHAIDFVRYITGLDYINVTARTSRQENGGMDELEISSAALYTMQDEVFATITADYLRPASAPTHGDDRIRVTGSAGVIEVRDNTAVLINSSGTSELPLPPNKKILASFIDSLTDDTHPQPLCTAEEAIYATEAALISGLSAQKKQTLSIESKHDR